MLTDHTLADVSRAVHQLSQARQTTLLRNTLGWNLADAANHDAFDDMLSDACEHIANSDSARAELSRHAEQQNEPRPQLDENGAKRLFQALNA